MNKLDILDSDLHILILWSVSSLHVHLCYLKFLYLGAQITKFKLRSLTTGRNQHEEADIKWMTQWTYSTVPPLHHLCVQLIIIIVFSFVLYINCVPST